MEFKLESYPCSCCNQNVTQPLLKKLNFSIVKCSSCGFVFVNPRVSNEQLEVIYTHDYFQNKDYGYVSYEQEKRLRVKNFERWLNDAQQYLPATEKIRAMDVGCAAGYCLEVMRDKGWIADGLELDAQLCKKLQDEGFNVTAQLLEEVQTEEKYSVITLFDVIEHISSIDEAFGQLNNLLAQDGIVVMVTPNYASLQRKIFGKRWFQYKPIEHIQYFTKAKLEVFAERNGLKMVFHQSSGQYADTQFILNRLKYYHFSFLSKLFAGIFSFFRIRNRFFYTDTGSIYAIFKKK